MKPASTTSSHAERLEPVAERAVARGAIGVVGDREDGRLDAGGLGPPQAARASARDEATPTISIGPPGEWSWSSSACRLVPGARDQDRDAKRTATAQAAAAWAGTRRTG